jgi:electron transfer flavoprotein alpha subunit
MATVRLGSSSGDVIVSMGLGMRGFEKETTLCAKRIGADLGASRSAVDAGMAPYEVQIGLTGRTVSPRVYLSLGISGALAHTCAIEGADCIIAVNTDKDARIFEYADYGILAEGREVLSFLQ